MAASVQRLFSHLQPFYINSSCLQISHKRYLNQTHYKWQRCLIHVIAAYFCYATYMVFIMFFCFHIFCLFDNYYHAHSAWWLVKCAVTFYRYENKCLSFAKTVVHFPYFYKFGEKKIFSIIYYPRLPKWSFLIARSAKFSFYLRTLIKVNERYGNFSINSLIFIAKIRPSPHTLFYYDYFLVLLL